MIGMLSLRRQKEENTNEGTDEAVGTENSGGSRIAWDFSVPSRRGCMDVLDMVAFGRIDGNGGDACDRASI